MTRTIIQLARAGDILSILPALRLWHLRGDELQMVVCPEFEPMFSSIPYVKPIVWDGPENGVAAATAWAKERGLPNIHAIQVNANPERVPPQRNFIVEQWYRSGELERFHELPLVVKRDPKRDEQLARLYMPHYGTRTIIGVCLQGQSSRMEDFGGDSKELMRRLHRELDGCYEVFDLGALRLPTIMDLLPLIARCHRLITIDTAHLHLAYASLTPTIALHRSHTWYQSEPRRHWIGRLTYEEAMAEDGAKRIVDMMEAEPPPFGSLCIGDKPARARRIIHLHSAYRPQDAETARRMEAAEKSWASVARHDGQYEVRAHELDGARSSKTTLGDTRSMPFIRDLFDYGCAGTDDDDIVLFTNSDILLAMDAPDAIRRAMESSPCCYSHRADFDRPVRSRKRRYQIVSRPQASGIDLFAFTPAWWKSVRDTVPDVLLGVEGWDSVVRWRMQETNPTAEIAPAICYHEMHSAYWIAHIRENPGQEWNRSLCRAWAIRNGYEKWLDQGRYLFREAPRP